MLEKDRRELARKLSRVQYAARLYAQRNNGEFPAGLLGGGGKDELDEAEDPFDSADPDLSTD